MELVAADVSLMAPLVAVGFGEALSYFPRYDQRWCRFKAFRPVLWHRDGPKAVGNRRLKKPRDLRNTALLNTRAALMTFMTRWPV